MKKYGLMILALAALVLPAAENTLKREATRPYDLAKFQGLELRRNFDLDHAVIVANDAETDAAPELLQEELRKGWGKTIPIRRVADRGDGVENLILTGSGMNNNLMRELAANLQIIRTATGPEVRVLPEAMDWKRGVIYLGGRNEAERREAVKKLLTRFPDPARLAFYTEEPANPEKPLSDPDRVVADVKAFYAGDQARKLSLTISTHAKTLFLDFRRTGDPAYVRAFGELLTIMNDNFARGVASNRNMPPTFEAQELPYFYYLFEQSDVFTLRNRAEAAELSRKIIEASMDCWEMVGPAESYRKNEPKYWTNHFAFASRTVYGNSRYLQSRAPIPGLDYFMAVADFTFKGIAGQPLSPEDAGGYQFLVYRIFTDYMLVNGRAAKDLFASDSFREYVDYAKGAFSHLGFTAGYGDAKLWGMRGAFVPLFESCEMTGDQESLAILSMICRSAGGRGFYAEQCQALGIPIDLPPPEIPRFSGLTTFTVSPARQELLGMTPLRHPALDKAIFRTSFAPDATFLAVNGLNGAPHGHDDAAGVALYLAGNRMWLFEGDYIRRFFEDHNVVSVVRNGASPERRRGKIAKSERAAQLIGSAVSEDRQRAVLTTLLEGLNGVNHYRHFCFDGGSGLWIIDELAADKPGDYRFSSRWRTTAVAEKATPQGVLLEQKPDRANPDDRRFFSISEGTGSRLFQQSEQEYSHGAGAEGSLSDYRYSDFLTRSKIFWKDAKMARGDRVFFVFYFKPQTGKAPQGVEISRLSPNSFAADGARVTINDDSTVTFVGRDNVVLSTAKTSGNSGDAAAGKGERIDLAAAAGSGETVAPLFKFDSPVTRSAAGTSHIGGGTCKGTFYLLDQDGRQTFKRELGTEISSVDALTVNGSEFWLVGTRPVKPAPDAPGRIFLFSAGGEKLWEAEIPAFWKRMGVPVTAKLVYPDGKDQPPLIAVGAESWHVFFFTLDGKLKRRTEVAHGIVSQAVGDLTGDGRDEVFPGIEYYYHLVINSDGSKTKDYVASPYGLASLIADLGAGNRAYAVRSDGFLYCHDGLNASKFEVNLGGPAYDLVRWKNTVAAVTVNGMFTAVDGAGKRKVSSKLPAPAVSTLAAKDGIYTAGLDGKVRRINGDNGKVTAEKSFPYAADCPYRPHLVALGDKIFVFSADGMFPVNP